jgi:hypothetical protein
MYTVLQTGEFRAWLDGVADLRARLRIVARLRHAQARAGSMSRARTRRKLLPFDAARYLTDDAAVAEYVTAVLETGDSDLLLLALGDVARARGMARVAKAWPCPDPVDTEVMPPRRVSAS